MSTDAPNTDALATHLATDAGLTAARSLQRLGLLPGQTRLPRIPPPESGPSPVLDWRPVQREGVTVFERDRFVRCKPKTIQPTPSGVTRVCLFGESLAAGFPMAPAFSPAIALEGLLSSTEGCSGPFEVIDLARPNMGPSAQLAVAEAARQIAPDVYVFMTGNNWHYGLSVEPTADPATRSQYAQQLGQGGPAALASTFRTALAARARVMLDVFAAATEGARAIVVIPPVNHAWSRRTPPPWLGEDRTARWYTLLEAGEMHLAAGAYDAVLDIAKTMASLDQGTTGTPHTLAAEAHRGAHRPAAAAAAAMDAVEAANWHNYSWALPQVPRTVADIMRAEATRLGYTCVDLTAAFTAHTGSPDHGFDLFLDQCHLTVEGTHVAMTAVSAAITGETPPPIDPPPAFVGASGAFQAAHWVSQFFPGRDLEEVSALVSRQLEAGVAGHPGLATVLLDQLRFKGLDCDAALHARFPKAMGLPGVGAALGSLALNPPQTMALIDVLSRLDPGGLEVVLDTLIASYEARLRDGIDLAHPWYSGQFWERTPLAWNDARGRHAAPLYRAPSPDSRFAVAANAHAPLALELVARTQQVTAVEIFVNERALGALVLGADWRRWRGLVPPDTLRRGLNHIRLAWRGPNMEDGAAIAEAERRLAMGIDADLFPVFGEVYSLTARRPLDP